MAVASAGPYTSLLVSVYLYLSVRLHTRISQKPCHVSKLYEIFGACNLPVDVAWSFSGDNEIRINNVLPVLYITLYFHVIGHKHIKIIVHKLSTYSSAAWQHAA